MSAIGSYVRIGAQDLDPFDSPEGMILAKVFTAAFPARARQVLPALERNALEKFCVSEWGDEAVVFIIS